MARKSKEETPKVSKKLGIPCYERYTPKGKQKFGGITAKSRIARSKSLMDVATDPNQPKKTKSWAFRQSKLEGARSKVTLASMANARGETDNVYAHLHNIETDLNPLMVNSNQKDENGKPLYGMKYQKTIDYSKRQTAKD